MNEQWPGTELMGLTRAFMYAGATAVLVSLWSVDDLCTGLLMEAFYRELRAGSDPAQALRAAQTRIAGMSAATAIAALTDRLAATAEPAERVEIQLGLGRLHTLAGDLAAAAEIYAALPEAVAGRQLRLVRFRAEQPVAPDHQVRPFRHPYYWAAFALVGDWVVDDER